MKYSGFFVCISCLLIVLSGATQPPQPSQQSLLPGWSVTLSQPDKSTWRTWATTTCTWTRPTTPHSLTDVWLGLFLVDYPSAYVQWISLMDDNNRYEFRVLNTRSAYVARIYTSSTPELNDDVLIAESNLIYPDGSLPTQIHITPVSGGSHSNNNDNRIRISWTTNSNDITNVRIRWGLNKFTAIDPNSVKMDSANTTPSYVTRTYTAEQLRSCVRRQVGLDPFDDIVTNPMERLPLSRHTARCEEGDHKCKHYALASHNFYNPGWQHSVVLGPLQSGEVYRYQISVDGGQSWTESSEFRAPLSRGDDSDFSVLYTADTGIGKVDASRMGSAEYNGARKGNKGDALLGAVARAAAPWVLSAREKLSLWLFNGDLTYSNGRLWVWERFMEIIEPLARHVPVAATAGNHELDGEADGREDNSGGECGVPLNHHFHLDPEVVGRSFDVGTVHFVLLNSEYSSSRPSPVAPPSRPSEWRQYFLGHLQFLESDLAAVDRKVTPWVVVIMHRPLHGSYSADKKYRKGVVPEFESVLARHKVNLFIGGHKHYYERTVPIGGVTYIVEGMGGRDDYKPHKVQPREEYPFTATRIFNSVGYLVLNVFGGRHMQVRRYDVNGTVVDTVQLTTQSHAENHRDDQGQDHNRPDVVVTGRHYGEKVASKKKDDDSEETTTAGGSGSSRLSVVFAIGLFVCLTVALAAAYVCPGRRASGGNNNNNSVGGLFSLRPSGRRYKTPPFV
eukprot:PhM_4_TR17749/c0_g1_i1/m.3674